MIGWQNLAAFWALPLLAVPILIHLLRVHRADRLLFPSLRFVQPSRTAAVRLRLPSDWLLLLLRLAIVAVVIAALAGPVVVTPARLRTWNDRTARAVIVDASPSMESGPAGPLVAQAREAARAETNTATYARVFEVQDLRSGLDRAAAWLATAPPARHEIVVLSDFQRDVLAEDMIAHVPASAGLKLVPIGRAPGQHTLNGAETLGAPGPPRVVSRHQTIALTPEATAAIFAPNDASGQSVGIRFVNALAAEQTSLLRAVAISGTPAASPDQPIAFVFDADKKPGALDGLSPVRDRWMLRTVLRLARERALGSQVRTGAKGQELVVGVASPASSFTAAAVVRAALIARRSTDDYAEQEIARTSDAVLAVWNRQAAPVDREVWRAVESTDGRWCWLLALVLLALEQWLRATSRTRQSPEVTRVAA